MTEEKRLYDEAAEQLCSHVETCQAGCRMHAWTCDEGQALLAAENAAWYAYRRAAGGGR